MIIECPACSTRYDIKATLPPDGRTVRCAKCSTVWRAMPEGVHAPAEVQAPAAEAEKPSISAGMAEEGNAGYRDTAEQSSPQVQAYASEWGRDNANESAVESAPVEESAPEQAQPEEPTGYQPQLAMEALETVLRRKDDAEEQGGDGEKVRWFSSFRRKNKQKFEADNEAAAGSSGAVSAETIPFRRPGFAAERQRPDSGEEELHTLEEARQAVRSVFSSLGDVRPLSQTRAFSSPITGQVPDQQQSGIQSGEAGALGRFGLNRPSGFSATTAEEPATGRSDFDTSSDDVQRPSTENGDWKGDEGEAEPGPAKAADNAWPGGEASESADPDTGLRDAMRAHFPASSVNEGLAQELETHFRSNASIAKDERSWSERTTALRNRPPLPLNELDEQTRLPDEDQSERKDDGAFDERLYREIEETREYAGAPRHGERRGGLALAAAWGLFLCAASGIFIGLFAFRDMAADALPGLAPVYRALGMPVTVQPLIFESVQYQWTVSEHKPALVVSGSVYNRAQRKVRVPQFFITIKDEDPALDREYSANLQINSSKIKSHQQADFEIELLSPNPTVTSIELELRNVR